MWVPGETHGRPGRRRQDSRSRLNRVIYPPDPRSLPSQLADQLRRRITSGDLAPGARLPPESDFAAQLGVSPGVMREALHTLAYLGLVERKRRRGTWVSRPRRDVGLLRASFGHASLLELHDVRVTTEAAAAERASTRVPPGHVPELSASLIELAAIRRTRAGPEAFVEADLKVHRLVVAAGGNSLTASIHRALLGALRSDLEHRYPALVSDAELHQLHFELARAVETGERAQAVALATQLARGEAPHLPVDEA